MSAAPTIRRPDEEPFDQHTTSLHTSGYRRSCSVVIEQEVTSPERGTRRGPSVADVSVDAIATALAPHQLSIIQPSYVTWMPNGRIAGDLRYPISSPAPPNTHASGYELNMSDDVYVCIHEGTESRGRVHVEQLRITAHARDEAHLRTALTTIIALYAILPHEPAQQQLDLSPDWMLP